MKLNIKQWDRVKVVAPTSFPEMTGQVITTHIHGIRGFCLVRYDHMLTRNGSITGKHMHCDLQKIENESEAQP